VGGDQGEAPEGGTGRVSEKTRAGGEVHEGTDGAETRAVARGQRKPETEGDRGEQTKGGKGSAEGERKDRGRVIP